MVLPMRHVVWASGMCVAFSYKAAFVEHEVVDPCGGASCGKQQKAASLKSYAEYIADAATQGAQIIVLPEYGITGESSEPKSSWVQGGYTDSIPEPTGDVPCDNADKFSEAPSVVSLSCAAKQSKIAVVANLLDYNGGKMYNTDVAFDTDGKFLAKYHKMNLWGEANIDSGSCRESNFTTSFGVTFGMFTCADLIFEHPAVDMVRKGIRNFVMPTAWSNEMAELQSMPYAQGWTALHGVNLILSNLRSGTGSGSGIWASGKTLASQYEPGGKTHKVVVAEVPDSEIASTRAVASQPSQAQPRFSFKSTANSQWKFGQLGSGPVCSGSVCCTANATSGSASGYVLGALDGTDGESFIGFPAQVCAVLPCKDASSDCLSYQEPQGNMQGVTLHMTGCSAPSVVPEVLATRGHNSEVLLTPGNSVDGFAFSKEVTAASLHVSTTMKVFSALIYGRSFDKDSLPYSCGSGPSPGPTPSPATCAACTKGGYNCDQWIAWDPNKYSCAKLEADLGCDCSGCSCKKAAWTLLQI